MAMDDDTRHRKYKLVYFHAGGAAELSRLVFRAAKVDFIDEYVSQDEWSKIKQDMPFGELPVLEISGRKYCQGTAIAQYLATEFDLMGSSNVDSLQINEIHAVMSDLYHKVASVHLEKDATRQETNLEELLHVKISRYLQYFTKRLEQNNNGTMFFIGNKLTLADLVVYNGLSNIRHFIQTTTGRDPITLSPLLQGHCHRVESCLAITNQ